jgi:hypothetical protein
MKKLILLAGLYCLQPNLHAASTTKHIKYDVAPTSASVRAMTHFKENYAWVQDAAWFNGPDNMYCIFHQGNRVNRVFYDQQGYWQYTLISYPPDGLGKKVTERVLGNFPGYHINYVNEIQSDSYEPVYMISIEDENNIKVLRVTGDDIQVNQALKKS